MLVGLIIRMYIFSSDFEHWLQYYVPDFSIHWWRSAKITLCQFFFVFFSHLVALAGMHCICHFWFSGHLRALILREILNTPVLGKWEKVIPRVFKALLSRLEAFHADHCVIVSNISLWLTCQCNVFILVVPYLHYKVKFSRLNFVAVFHCITCSYL